MEPLIQDLEAALAPQRVLTQAVDRMAYAGDASFYRMVPQAVAQPGSLDEVRALFEISRRWKVPLVFRGAGTSLSGQSVTDGILVDSNRFWRGMQIEEGGSRVRLSPGVLGGMANRVLGGIGRRIGPDPASIDAATLGGILANNASGMCCGVAENAYHTLHSLTMLLPNGLTLDSADPQAAQKLRDHSPHIAQGLLDLRQRILRNPVLTRRIHEKFQGKNTCGYSLNAFVDYSEPLEILTHLMIGSEGTLGFIGEAVLHTLPVYPYKTTALIYFETVQAASDAVAPLRESGARAIEILDRSALRAVQDQPGAPDVLRDLPAQATALLVEYQCGSAAELAEARRAADRVCKSLRLLLPPEFTEDPHTQALYWKIRKGTFPAVGAMRPPGTTVVIEDVAFPVPRLAAAITDLQSAFQRHNYPDTIIFGHAKEGNLHFVMAPSFQTESDIHQYGSFIQTVVDLVVNGYDGALKAEHGTGRNMAPFVQAEWGADAMAIMRDLKDLLDPDNLLNPGVILNPDPHAHLRHIKPLPLVDPLVDRCIECGFCEPKCPSRDLTLTPRQRIAVSREMARLRAVGDSPALLAELQSEYPYAALETCAADGMCATDCPVTINTGKLVKHLRSAGNSPRAQSVAGWVGRSFHRVESGLRLGVWAGHAASSILGVQRVVAIEKAAGRALNAQLPLWSAEVPRANFRRLPVRRRETAEVVYFPSCITRVMGSGLSDGQKTVIDTLVEVADRAGIQVYIPPDSPGNCCGMPFSSKGFDAAYRQVLARTLANFWDWSDQGRLPVVIDSSSCAYTLRSAGDDLDGEALHHWQHITFLDPLDFLHDLALPNLTVHRVPGVVALHPNCSAQKEGLANKMVAIARACAEDVFVPLHLNCCGFAGDRGLLFPELTASAASAEAAEVNQRSFAGYYSSNLTCEMGMTRATGKPYQSIVYLVEAASR